MSKLVMSLPDPRQVSDRTQLIRSDFLYIYDVANESMASEVTNCFAIYSCNVLAEFPLTSKPRVGPWMFVLCDVMPDLRLMLLLNTINETGAKAKSLYLETGGGCTPSNAELLDLILMYNLPQNKDKFLASVPILIEQIHFSPNTSVEFAAGCCFVERAKWMQPKQLDVMAATLGVEINRLWVESGDPPFYSKDASQGRSTLDFEPLFVTSLSSGISFTIGQDTRKRTASGDASSELGESAAKRATTSNDAAVTTDDMDRAFLSGRLQQPAIPFRESDSEEDGDVHDLLTLPRLSPPCAGTSRGAPVRQLPAEPPGMYSNGTIRVPGSELLQMWALDGPVAESSLPSASSHQHRERQANSGSSQSDPQHACVVNSPIRHWVLSPFKAELTDVRIRDAVLSFLDNVDQVLVLPYFDAKQVVRKRVIFTERSPAYRSTHERLETISNTMGFVDVLSSPRLVFDCLLAERPHPDSHRHPGHAFWVPLSFKSAELLHTEFLLITNLHLLCTNQQYATYIKTRFTQAECFHVVAVKSLSYAVIKFSTCEQCLQTYMAMQFRGGASSVHNVCQLDYLSLIGGRLRMPSHDFLSWISATSASPPAAASEVALPSPPLCSCHPSGEFLRVAHQPSMQNLTQRLADTLGAFRINLATAPTALVVRTAELMFDPNKAFFADQARFDDSQASVRDFYAMLGSPDLAHGSINCSEPGVPIPGLAYRLKWILTGSLCERKPLPRGKSYRTVSSPIRHWCIANVKQKVPDQRLEAEIVKAVSHIDRMLIYLTPSNQYGLQKCAVFTESEPSCEEMRTRIVSASGALLSLSNTSTGLDYHVRMSEDPNLESSALVHWVPLSYETAQVMETQFLFVSGFQPSRTAGMVVMNYFASYLPNALSIHAPCHLDKSLDYAVLRFPSWELCADAYRYVLANLSVTGVRGCLVCMLDYVEIGDSMLRVPCHNLLPWYESKVPSGLGPAKPLALVPLDKSDFNCACHPQANCLRQCITKDLLPLVTTCVLNWAATPKKLVTVNQCVIEMLRAKAKNM